MSIHGYVGNIITANPTAPTVTSASGVWTTEQQLAAVSAGNWPGYEYPVTQSLRFNSADSAYLNRTPGSATDRQKWTWSSWVKLGSLTINQIIFSAGATSGANVYAYWNTTNTLSIRFDQEASGNVGVTAAVNRDPSAWYHVVFALDTTQATAANRVKIYINGVQQDTTGSTFPSQNFNTAMNNNVAHSIGRRGYDATSYASFLLSEIIHVDGQQLTPSSFGLNDPETGVWSPKRYTGTYGTNGFYLNFSDNSGTTSTTLGKDSSGNSNNWTPNNFSVTAGAGNDSLVDSPTSYGTDTGAGGEVRGNYCTLNPLDKNSNLTLSNGNLDFVPADTSGLYSGRSTFQIPSTGKWIWQVTNTNSAYMITAGLIDGTTPLLGQPTVSCASMTVGSIGTFFSTTQWMNSTTTWSVTNVGNGDTLVIAYDADAGYIWFGRVASGGSTVSWYSTSGTADPSTGTDPRASGITAGKWFAGVGAYFTPSGASINYGQRPFAFTNAPSGFKALCTTNLPTPTIGASSTTLAGKYFGINLWTGNGSTGSRVITGLGFKPDWVWWKNRTTAKWHQVFDSNRGADKALSTNATDAEDASGGYGGEGSVTSFDSDGYTLQGGVGNNENGSAIVGWAWQAGQGTNSSNTAGTITSTVSASTTSGFSIVTYTGTGANATVGHGLGVAPQMVIVKQRNGVATYWCVYHTSLASGYAVYLNATFAAGSDPGTFNSTAPTSSVFSIGTSTATNTNTNTYVAYVFAPVAGYSAFGSYTGNGSSDGPFVYTNFRPEFVMIKNASATGDWFIYDAARNTYNVADNRLKPNLSDAEGTGGSFGPDILSNGFKMRSNFGEMNGSGNTIIYMAFAESPFKYALAR